jgi:hypothetical protein
MPVDSTSVEGNSQTPQENAQASETNAGGTNNAAQDKAGKDSALLEEATKAIRAGQELLAKSVDLKEFSQAYVSTMQLWVEQADEEGKNTFYSSEPVHIGFLPLSQDYWRDTLFKPWEFENASNNGVTLHECSYLPKRDQSEIEVSLLGMRSWPKWLNNSWSTAKPQGLASPDNVPMEPIKDRPDWAKLANGYDADIKNQQCGQFTVPTAALVNDPIVFSMEFPPHPPAAGSDRLLRTTIAIPKSRLAPRFKQSEIHILSAVEPPRLKNDKKQTEVKVWQIDIPVVNTACGDQIELPTQLVRSTGSDFTTIDWYWRDGNVELAPCVPKPIRPADPKSDAFKKWEKDLDTWEKENPIRKNAWQAADSADRIRLYLEIPRTAINDLPDRVDVVRTTTDGVKWVVATLPDLRRLLLPSQLTIDPLTPTQFALRGDNAGVIDAVAMQSSSEKTAVTFTTAPGVDFALVMLPSATDSTPKTDTSGGGGSAGAGGNSSTEITVDTTKDSTGHVKMTTQSSSTPAKPASTTTKAPDTAPSGGKTSAPQPLAAGTYAVIPLIQVRTTVPTALTLKDKADKATAAKKAADDATAAAAAAKASPADKNLKQKAATAASKSATAKAAAAAAAQAAEPAPIYMPLTVSDEKGKPLIFTIADTKKPAAAQASTTPTPCTTSCTVAPCTPACAALQGASTKSQ